MPTVKSGKVTRTYPYNPAGEKAATGFAAKTGGTLTRKKKKKKAAPKMPKMPAGMPMRMPAGMAMKGM